MSHTHIIMVSYLFCSCRPYGIPFYVGLLTPFVIIYIFNWIIFVIVLAYIMKQQRDTKFRQANTNTSKQIRQQLISAIVLSLLFGLGWGFALPATQGINSSIVQILFQAIYIALTAFQGVFIFIMHCLVGRKSIMAKQEWKRWMKRVSTRSSIFSSSVYSKSTLDRVHKRVKSSDKDGTLSTSANPNSTLQRGENVYDLVPQKAPLQSSSAMESVKSVKEEKVSRMKYHVSFSQNNSTEPFDVPSQQPDHKVYSDRQTVKKGNKTAALMMAEDEAEAMVITNPLALHWTKSDIFFHKIPE